MPPILMAMLTLREGTRERQINAADLVVGVTNGRIEAQSTVLLPTGEWQRCGLWYLEHSEIHPAALDEISRFLDRHAVEGVSVESVRTHLNLSAGAKRAVDQHSDQVAQVIEVPQWGAGFDLAAFVTNEIEMPTWSPDPSRAIVASIAYPKHKLGLAKWGRPYELPVVDSIIVPPWRDPAVAGVAVPPPQNVKWIRTGQDEPDPPDALLELLGICVGGAGKQQGGAAQQRGGAIEQSTAGDDPGHKGSQAHRQPTRAELRRKLRNLRPATGAHEPDDSSDDGDDRALLDHRGDMDARETAESQAANTLRDRHLTTARVGKERRRLQDVEAAKARQHTRPQDEWDEAPPPKAPALQAAPTVTELIAIGREKAEKRKKKKAARAKKQTRVVSDPVVASPGVASPAVASPVISGIAVEKSSGFIGCFARLVALSAVAFGAVVGHELVVDAVGETLQELDREGATQTRQGSKPGLRSPLISTGPDEAQLQVVAGVDFSAPAQSNFATELLRATQKIPFVGGTPRLTILPVSDGTVTSKNIRDLIVAADHAGCFWPWLHARGTVKGKRLTAGAPPPTTDALHTEFKALPCDHKKFERGIMDPAVDLRSRTLATMARALGLSPQRWGFANHVMLPREDVTDPDKLADLLRLAAAETAKLMAANNDDRAAAMRDVAAKMPPDVRMRFSSWIVDGERLPTHPVVVAPKPIATVASEAVDKANLASALQVPASVPRKGAAKPKIEVVVFCDYLSPHCRTHAKVMDALVEEFGDKLALRWIQFPLSKHKARSRIASTAALAAHKQGLFWPAHQWLGANVKKRVDRKALVKYLQKIAKKRGKTFDKTRFDRDRVAAYSELVRLRRTAKEAQVDGAPYTVVGTRIVRGAADLATFKDLVATLTKSEP